MKFDENMDGDIPTTPMHHEEEESNPDKILEWDKEILQYMVHKIYKNDSGVKRLQLQMESLRNELQAMKEEQKNIMKDILKMINRRSDIISDVDTITTTATTTNNNTPSSIASVITTPITNKQKSSLIDVNHPNRSNNNNYFHNICNAYQPRTNASVFSPAHSKSYTKKIANENSVNFNEKLRKRNLSPEASSLPFKKKIVSIDLPRGFKPIVVDNIRKKTIKVNDKVREKEGNKDDDVPQKDINYDDDGGKKSKNKMRHSSRQTFNLIMKHPSLSYAEKLDESVPKLIKNLETRCHVRFPKHKRFTKFGKFKDAVILCFDSSEKRYQFEKIIKELKIPRSEKLEVYVEKIFDEESDNSDLGRYLKNAKVSGAVGNYYKEENSDKNFIFSFKGDQPSNTHKITSVDEYLKLLECRESDRKKEERFTKILWLSSNGSGEQQTTSINNNDDKNSFYGKSHWR